MMGFYKAELTTAVINLLLRLLILELCLCHIDRKYYSLAYFHRCGRTFFYCSLGFDSAPTLMLNEKNP